MRCYGDYKGFIWNYFYSRNVHGEAASNSKALMVWMGQTDDQPRDFFPASIFRQKMGIPLVPIVKEFASLSGLFDLVGGLRPSEKYESQLGWLFPISWKIKNVPNHQTVIISIIRMCIIYLSHSSYQLIDVHQAISPLHNFHCWDSRKPEAKCGSETHIFRGHPFSRKTNHSWK